MSTSSPRLDLIDWCSLLANDVINRPDLRARLVVKPTRRSVMEFVGNLMADEVAANNAADRPTRWVLPTGPMDEYDTFITRINSEHISLANLYVFHMDEFLDRDGHPYPVGDTYESLEGTMKAGFYDRIDPDLNVPEGQRIWPRIGDVNAPDRRCGQLGGVDTVWAGVGHNGLVAFCQPSRAPTPRSVEAFATSLTQIVDLAEDTVTALAQRTFGSCTGRVPPRAITIGMNIMASARRVVYMVATGAAWKATAVRALLFAPPTTDFPVTVLNSRVAECILVCDEATLDHPLSHPIRGW